MINKTNLFEVYVTITQKSIDLANAYDTQTMNNFKLICEFQQLDFAFQFLIQFNDEKQEMDASKVANVYYDWGQHLYIGALFYTYTAQDREMAIHYYKRIIENLECALRLYTDPLERQATQNSIDLYRNRLSSTLGNALLSSNVDFYSNVTESSLYKACDALYHRGFNAIDNYVNRLENGYSPSETEQIESINTIECIVWEWKTAINILMAKKEKDINNVLKLGSVVYNLGDYFRQVAHFYARIGEPYQTVITAYDAALQSFDDAATHYAAGQKENFELQTRNVIHELKEEKNNYTSLMFMQVPQLSYLNILNGIEDAVLNQMRYNADALFNMSSTSNKPSITDIIGSSVKDLLSQERANMGVAKFHLFGGKTAVNPEMRSVSNHVTLSGR